MDLGDFFVPWTSFGPWQSHLGPPGAPSWPEVAIFYDIWGHFGAHLGTGGVFFDACRLQELKKEGWGRRSEPEPLFHRFLGLLHGVSLQRERCFHFGGQWQIIATLGSTLVSFWEPKAQLYSL